jgi:3-hydroxyacyl-CoA dehydrogenase
MMSTPSSWDERKQALPLFDMSDVVSCQRLGEVLIITIDNPPVNALGHGVRQGLLEAIAMARSDAAIRAVVLAGAGSVFIGGADIREFGKARLSPWLVEICAAVESLVKPVIAAIHGAALGGGLELAMAAHYRIAGPQAEFGLPEVLLGLIPGAGGTQRAPRLMGVKAALDLMLSGRRLQADAACNAGLVDRVVNDPLYEALHWARELVASHKSARRTCDMPLLGERVQADADLQAARSEIENKTPHLFSPKCIVDAVQASQELPFALGMQREAELFSQCLASAQRQALVHLFMAERTVGKIPEARVASARSFERIGVVGGGTMGVGIAVAVLDSGLQVILVERDAAALQRAKDAVTHIYETLVHKKKQSSDAVQQRLARLHTAVGYAALADADMVIEAVFEDMEVKKSVFGQLDAVCKPGAVLATNTSYLDVDAIAASTHRVSDVIGLHFFSPAHVMKLLEVVVPKQASADAVATGFALAKRLRKVAVRAGVCDGFIGNRMLSVYRRAAEYMVEDGASPYDVDAALRGFGFPMGPFQVMDLAGGDIAWATRKRRATNRPAQERYVHIADRLCERGWFGQKSGRGWYRYSHGDRRGEPDPEVLAIIEQERQRQGRPKHNFSVQEIVERYLAAMINEGANVVHEGIALRPLDVDVTLVNGYGFPRHAGGPMMYADQQGLSVWVDRMRIWSVQDPYFWRPSALLLDLVHRGEGFASLNRLHRSSEFASRGAYAPVIDTVIFT